MGNPDCRDETTSDSLLGSGQFIRANGIDERRLGSRLPSHTSRWSTAMKFRGLRFRLERHRCVMAGGDIQ